MVSTLELLWYLFIISLIFLVTEFLRAQPDATFQGPKKKKKQQQQQQLDLSDEIIIAQQLFDLLDEIIDEHKAAERQIAQQQFDLSDEIIEEHKAAERQIAQQQCSCRQQQFPHHQVQQHQGPGQLFFTEQSQQNPYGSQFAPNFIPSESERNLANWSLSVSVCNDESLEATCKACNKPFDVNDIQITDYHSIDPARMQIKPIVHIDCWDVENLKVEDAFNNPSLQSYVQIVRRQKFDAW